LIVIVPISLVILLVVAFVVYGAITRIGPEHYARGGPSFAAQQPSATASATGTVSGAPHSASPTSSRSASPTVGSSTPPPLVNPKTIPGIAVPRTGAYAVHVDGSEKVRFGPVSFCDRRLPTTSTLIVSKSAGESATSYNFDHGFFPGQKDMHDERHIYRYTKSGVFLDYEQATVTCAGIRQATIISFRPPELKVRLPLRVGAKWTGRGGNGSRTETYSTRVVRSETLRIGGKRIPTYVIEASITLTGQESGRRFQRWWYAPSRAMAMRWHEEISASRMGATYSMAATFAIQSMP
jgi:hypothetical protein